MNRKISVLTAVFFIAVVAVCLLSTSAFALGINPTFKVDGKSASTLAEAFEKAKSGSVIAQDGNTSTLYEISDTIVVDKDVTLKTGKDFNGTVNRIQYNGKTGPLFVVKKGVTLTLTDATIFGNENSQNLRGGLILVENGGTLVLNATKKAPVVLSGSKLTAQGSKGGAVYVEEGGKAVVRGATFKDNSASEGNDVFAERTADVTEEAPETDDETEPVATGTGTSGGGNEIIWSGNPNETTSSSENDPTGSTAESNDPAVTGSEGKTSAPWRPNTFLKIVFVVVSVAAIAGVVWFIKKKY